MPNGLGDDRSIPRPATSVREESGPGSAGEGRPRPPSGSDPGNDRPSKCGWKHGGAVGLSDADGRQVDLDKSGLLMEGAKAQRESKKHGAETSVLASMIHQKANGERA